jgi:HK97 family phage prohead protease
MPANYDFCGWATRNDIQCSDGRTIRKDAFKDNDGMTVPLVWNHQHNEPYNVLGHALLENRDDGVYAYGYFNGTESGKNAKELLRNGDIHYMSIYANRLKQNGGNVLHGMIREVSLVLAGANPGANIEAVMVHADGFEDEEDLLIVNQQDQISLAHADEPEEKKPEEDKKEESEAEKKPEAEEEKAEEKKPEEEEKPEKEDPDKKAENQKPETEEAKEDEPKSEDKPAEEGKPEGEASHADNDEEALAMADGSTKEKTVQDVFDEFTDEQKNVVYALIGAALEQAKDGGNGEMKQNAFENGQNGAPEQEVLTHAEMQEIMQDAQELGSLKKAVLQHGITNIDLLFPDYKNYTDKPGFIDRPQGWVKDVMGSVGKTPFTRVKSMFADITGDEARARGYVKGDQKVDEVFALLKRETAPQTVYKKQSLDRDDVIDITDFDVVAWLRQEMRGKLDEELARAILVGDGRSASSADKIKEANIRPIWTDDPDLFTVRANVPASDNMPKSFIRTAVKARKDYKGSGNPVLYCSEEWLTECLLLEDSIGRPLYDSEAKLATAMRVSKIVSVPVMENLTRTDELGTHKLMGIIVNLKDYNVGCDKGGQVSMFDDFDIDYNKQKYLIETRVSGALVVPFSAIILEQLVESNPG